MPRVDRLTTLMSKFSLSVQPAELGVASLIVLASKGGEPGQVLFKPAGLGFNTSMERVLISASVDWGGVSNPLMAALPDLIELSLSENADTAALVSLMQSEFEAQRCGVDSVVNRLGEVLIVRLLRHQIEIGSAEPGLLAGLADPRISRAIVAIHDAPGRVWRNDDLAQIAGLSLSRFAETFLSLVGETPAAYLRRWRLTLANQDIRKGDRIEAVARRYGYSSTEGFSKAFKKQFGEVPVALRRRAPV